MFMLNKISESESESEDDTFCFGFIQLKGVCSHPFTDVRYAGL